jgi:hypothetical protein
VAANPAIALRLQSTRPLGRVADIGSLLALNAIPKLMNAKAIPVQRSRLVYAIAIALVIGTGLLWRSDLLALPNFVTKYGGDSLWALVVFLCFGFAFHHSSRVRIALGAVSLAWSVEFLQLYHAHWIDGLRSTRLGQLFLGSTFNSPDLLAYAIGVALGALLECVYLNENQKA